MQTKRGISLRVMVFVLLLLIAVTSVAAAADGGLQVANPKIVREITTTLSE